MLAFLHPGATHLESSIALSLITIHPAGTITVDELRKVLERLGGTSPEEVEEILAKVDKNNDGSIDYEEFVEMMKPASTSGPVRRRHDNAIKF